jgi:hypothetical protein
MLRIRQRNPGLMTIKIMELKRAIMYEIGTDPRTYKSTKKALTDLGWIRSKGNKWTRLTDVDLSDG